MKKLCYLFGVFCGLALLCSCVKVSDFEEDMLIGKWGQELLFEKYFADGNGYMWDEGDDVKEDEAQKFEWKLEKNKLTQVHLGKMGQKIPKYYTVTELNASNLKYKDDYGKGYSFKKL